LRKLLFLLPFQGRPFLDMCQRHCGRSAGSAHALGVGGLRVQSGLGQPLKAQLDVTGADAQDADIQF
jgi:Tfp pilus assembly protein FimV